MTSLKVKHRWQKGTDTERDYVEQEISLKKDIRRSDRRHI